MKPIDEIVALYEQGLDILDIAKIQGCSRQAISERFRRKGINVQSVSKLRTMLRNAMKKAQHIHGGVIPLPKDEILLKYKSGIGIWRIARDLSVSPRTIKRRLIDWNAYVYDRSKSWKHRHEGVDLATLDMLYSKGATSAEIARQMNRSEMTITRALDHLFNKRAKRVHIP